MSPQRFGNWPLSWISNYTCLKQVSTSDIKFVFAEDMSVALNQSDNLHPLLGC